jgi:tetratricopeptide (TPR) repeat protein
LLVPFRRHHPEALPAYQLLCEIYWDQENFEKALALLDALPSDLTASVAAVRLRGETLTRAGEHESARRHYNGFIDTHGWNSAVAHNLARTCLEMQDSDRARELYRGIIDRCRGCGARIDPQIRHEYAELCFAESRYDNTLLETYLTLAQEIPINAALYYRRVAQIYAHQGHDHEARRFTSFARQADANTNDEGLPRDRT